MPLFLYLLGDCLIILFIVTLVTQVLMPLARRELVFPFFRRLVNKISKPKNDNE